YCLGIGAAKQWSKLGSHLKHLNLTFPFVSFHSGIRNDPAFFCLRPQYSTLPVFLRIVSRLGCRKAMVPTFSGVADLQSSQRSQVRGQTSDIRANKSKRSALNVQTLNVE